MLNWSRKVIAISFAFEDTLKCTSVMRSVIKFINYLKHIGDSKVFYLSQLGNSKAFPRASSLFDHILESAVKQINSTSLITSSLL